MADPLSLLRQYNIQSKQIIERDNQILFGEFSWPKTVNTNYIIWGTGKDGAKRDYYTLEGLLYLLKNRNLQHPVYVRQAAAENVPIVRRPDRKDLLAYLNEPKAAPPASIDKSARLEMATHVKRTSYSSVDETVGLGGIRPVEPAAKKARIDETQKIRDSIAAKLGVSQEGKLSINKANLKNLSADLTADKIAEIKAKMFAKRRTRIKPEDDENRSFGGVGGCLSELDADKSRDIYSRERVWRTRTTILQSSGKIFSKSITAILASVKTREDGGREVTSASTGNLLNSNFNSRNAAMNSNAAVTAAAKTQLPNYNRYDQERFRGKDETHGFNIETTGTFSGMTLKSVTEGNQNRNRNLNSSGYPTQSPHRIVGASTKLNNPLGTPGGTSRNGPQSQKRPSRTPIIIIPAAPKSLITMFNAKDILQDLRFVSSEDKKNQGGGKRDNELLIQRRKEGGLTVPYRVVDNAAKLTNAEWERVVAVFVMGQAWQFKGWPWDGNPTVIFSKISAFHLKWDETNLEKNIGNWAVNVIQLSRNKRHLDRAKLMMFWEALDRYMTNNKPHLRF